MRKIDDTSSFHIAVSYRAARAAILYYELKEFPSSFDILVCRVFDTLAACSRIRRF